MQKQVFIDQTFDDLRGHFKDAVFYNCTFKKLSGLTLEHCDLNRSQVTAKNPSDLLGLTVTLDCHTFGNVELSEEAFDFMLMLLCKTSGNTEKRKALLSLIGTEKAIELLKIFDRTE